MRKFPNQDVNFSNLRSTLVNSGLARENPPLYQVISQLLEGTQILRSKINDKTQSVDLESQVTGILPPRFGGNNVSMYVPQMYLMANLSGSGVDDLYYQHSRDQVIVFGRFVVLPTAVGVNTELGFELPLKSYFDFPYQCAGSGYSPTVDQGCAIIGDPVNKRAKMQFISATNVQFDLYFTFGYKIIEQ